MVLLGFRYFGEVSFDRPFLHCWSLAVEEQFYLVLPLLLAAIDLAVRAAGCRAFAQARTAAAAAVAQADGPPSAESVAQDVAEDVNEHEITMSPVDARPAPAEFGSSDGNASLPNDAPDVEKDCDCVQNSRRNGRSAELGFGLALLTLLVASFIAAVLVASRNAMFAFYLLPTRAWEPLLGSVLAVDRYYGLLSPLFHTRVATEIASWCGLLMIATAYFVLNDTLPGPSYPTLLPTLGTALFLVSQEDHPCRGDRLSTCGKLLAMQVPALVGEMSYSLYLWHWPVFVLLSYNALDFKLNAGQKALGIAVSFVAACASLILVESPFRLPRGSAVAPLISKMYLRTVTNRVFLALMFATWSALVAYCLAASFLGLGGNSFHARMRNGTAMQPSFTNDTGGRCVDLMDEKRIDQMYNIAAPNISLDNILGSRFEWTWLSGFSFEQDPVAGYGELKGGSPKIFGPNVTEFPTVVFVGSSHMKFYGPIARDLAEEFGVRIAFLVMDGNWAGKFWNPLQDWDRVRLDFLEKWRPRLVVWVGFWGGRFDGKCERTFAYGYPFPYAFDLLLAHSEKLLVLGDIPTLPLGCSGVGCSGDSLLRLSVYKMYVASGNFLFLTTAKEEPTYRIDRLAVEGWIKGTIANPEYSQRVSFVEVAPYFESAAPDYYLQLVDPQQGTLVYFDSNHLSLEGAWRVIPLFRRYIFGQRACSF